ncbi:hypothetical protein [Antrihabitans sp. YC2-6]|uniref:hypothetical protein n=1 Tax=Antrihabitans sp. YC2-6 TaxID=2799498 RepID=UPI0018F4B3F7|nr:hypothetical protein [Antrihabitans sp. YC2-6]MBJ8347844.1 hypothetical protein [Antrihabitans sp. YC2-6]
MGELEDAPVGIALPLSRPGRSATEFAKAVLADAVRPYDADLSQAIESARSWRSEYMSALRAITAVCASSPSAAVGIAAEGLRSAHALVRFVDGSVEGPLNSESWRSAPDDPFETAVVEGSSEPPDELRVPVDGVVLSGQALRDKLVDWRNRGVVEPSFVLALERVIENPKWLRLPGYQAIVVGASEELGPYRSLVEWGADVLAIDAVGPNMWRDILDVAKRGAGTVTYPTGVRGPGADLAHEFPKLLKWIYANTSKRKKQVLGTYTLGDRGGHIEATLAADVIASDLLENRPNTTLAYLTTPTDCFAVKADVMAEARRRWADRGIKGPLENALRFASRSALFKPNYVDEVVDYEGNHWGMANALIGAQGPEFALARRLQRWRAALARDAGRPVSFGVAPASLTKAVTRNRLLTSAYHGAGKLGVEVFEPETTRVLMAAKLVSDLFAPAPVDPHSNPEELFYEGAAHGGLWRQPFEPMSALSVAVASGYPYSLFRRK